MREAVLTLATATYIPAVSAQTGLGPGGPQAELVEFFNEIVFYGFEVNSVPEIALYFIAPLFAFYMLNKNIFHVGFESFEDRIDRSDYNVSGSKEELPTGLKGLALATAFIMVQMIGVLGVFMLAALAGLAYIVWLLNYIDLFGNLTGGGSGTSSSSGGGGGSSEESLESAENEVSEADRERRESEQKEQDAENTGNDNEARNAQQEFEHAISELEAAEQDLEGFFERKSSEINNLVSDVKEFLEDEENTLNRLKDFENKAQNIESNLDVMLTEVGQLTARNNANAVHGEINSDLSDLISEGDGFTDFEKAFANIKDNLSYLEKDIGIVEKIIKEEEVKEEDDLGELINIVRQYREAEKIIENLPSELKSIVEDEEEMEGLAKELSDKELFEEAEKTEEEIQNALNNYEKIRSVLEKQEKAISDASTYLEKQFKILRHDLDELQKIRGQYIPELEETAMKVIENIQTLEGDDEQKSALIENISGFRDRVDNLEGVITTVEQEEGKIEEKVGRFLKKVQNTAMRNKKFD